MGRSIYFTEKEISQIIHYTNEAIGILGEGEKTQYIVERDMRNGLGSALRKLYKGKAGEELYDDYKKY